ncbi:putative bifunctional diguanylate cyclase/phosphodiesterase [Cellulomonas pakistanensis]|uniref:GGDEF-domain containing protein n=1 Tax=Cellulomonas pakistanensis TaxID=992287 RepID=A0A919P9X1_9CELL|nr:bifunctional diguanylate cyclase/phosphodiesterase [Cellulomonas pakistanensis]GIG35793.1 hypothetical protein Cpa01nite_11740 [Cellulomonas pakistanensis]
MNSHRTRSPRAHAPRALLLLAGLLVAAAGVVETTCVAPGLTTTAGALAAAAGAGVLTARLPHTSVDERELWRWVARGCWAVAAGMAAETALAALLDGAAPGRAAGGPLTVGAVLGCVLAYQGLVRWNRYRTTAAEPGDWLGGLSWLLAAAALVLTVLHHVRTTAAGPGWALEGHVTRLSVLLILVGTTLTVTLLSGLHRDVRAWTLAGGLAAMAGLEAVGAHHLVLGPEPAVDAALVPAAWASVVVVAAWMTLLPPAPNPVRYASSQVLTVGSLLVIVCGAGLLLAHGLGPGGPAAVPVLATLAVLGGCARVLRTLRDLAQLASTRVEARTDPLTGVANRRAFLESLAGTQRRGAALLVVDLDRFKEVNDRYGHAAGDAVIGVTAGRLREELAGRGVLARLGGDEFAVVLDDPDVARAAAIAEAMRAAVQVPVDVAGRIVRIDASIGVSSTELGERDHPELLRWADAAMYAAKQAGGGVRVYDEAVDAHERDQRALADDLRAMLTGGGGGGRHGEVVLHFQPQLDCRDGSVVGMEALARWRHPERGLLPPVAFIDLAEQHGVMFALTTEVLDQAARQAARWRAAGRDFPVAVNLSTSCLEHPRLIEVVDDVLARTGLPAEGLVVEITETTLMHDPAHAVAVTRAVAERGVGVSIDDYGSGYSSLTYLNELPARELKLDRSFTARLTSDERTHAIVSGTVDLAHHLGLRLIAEGVEDAGTSAVLRELGCDRTQGYLHSRPLPADDVTAWLREHDRAVGRVPALPSPRRGS